MTSASSNVANQSTTTAKPANTPTSNASYGLEQIPAEGRVAFNGDPLTYKVFCNVKDYGAKGDGSTDDTDAINKAITDGSRCGPVVCQSSTTTPALVYFPAGVYIVKSSIIPYYMTQMIGNPNDMPVLKATSDFQGLGVIDGDPYKEGGNGEQGWKSVNIFMRQIRNFHIDLANVALENDALGIHWPTAQATSLQNIKITMTKAKNSKHVGLFVENGSGGFMCDIVVTGGKFGFQVGNQQFTMRNISISNAVVGIEQIWNWGWLYQRLDIRDCEIAVNMTAGGSQNQTVGSMVIIDSEIANCPIFVDSAWSDTSLPKAGGQLILENIELKAVPAAVKSSGKTVLAGGDKTIGTWGQGLRIHDGASQSFQETFAPVNRPNSLLESDNKRFYAKSKPQYADLGLDSFLSVRSAGAKGDGQTDDTDAIQKAINSAISSNKILFFNHGVYNVTKTIHIPQGARIVGEAYPVIMASGALWSDKTRPEPVIQIGNPNDTGSIEWSDMIVSTYGSAPGAKLIEWNLAADRGSGMWDVHTRIGGWKGTGLQVEQCPVNAAVSEKCMAAYMSMHITPSARGAYLENTWFWTSDHDLDDFNSTQISIFTGRGLLVSGTSTILYGTGVEHHSPYQYHLSNTTNLLAGFIQTETPYWQPVPDAKSQPYHLNPEIRDPDYNSFCSNISGGGNCNALGLRILDSSNISIYGAGLYSFFNNYSTTCSDSAFLGDGKANCQERIFSVEGASDKISVYGLSTVGSQKMVTVDGEDKVDWSGHVGAFADCLGGFRWK